jgi:hypothetical protein
VLFCAQGIAISEDAATAPPLRHILDIALAVRPGELVAPGDVTLIFEITNLSEYSADNLCFTTEDGGHPERLGQLPPGDSQVFTGTYSVTEAELEAGEIALVVSHDDIMGDEEPVNYEVSAQIVKAEAAPELEFTRHISAAAISEGSALTITYRVRNVGNVPLSRIRVKDKLGDFTGRVDGLECGGEKVFTSRITATGDMVSKATVSYEAPSVDDETRELTLEDVTVPVVQPELTAALTLDRSVAGYGDTVNGIVAISAIGADFTDVYVMDDVNGTLLADSYEIPAGESVNIACSWPVRAPSDYRLMVSGLCSTGDRMEIATNTENVQLSGEFSDSKLGISATAETPVINRAGKVRINVAIENTGNSAARDVILREAGLGEVRRFAFVPAGEPTYRQVLVDVKENTTFEFSVCILDANGNEQTVQAVAVPIAIAADGASPEQAASGSGGGFAQWAERNMDDRTAYTWMLLAAGGVLTILVIILLVSHGREHMDRRQRKARSRQRRRDEAGRIHRQPRKK